MKNQSIRFATSLIALLMLLSTVACASSAVETSVEAPAELGANADSAYEPMSDGESFAMEEMEQVAAEDAAALSGDEAAYDGDAAAVDAPLQTTGLENRKIIREATIRLEADDVTTALNQATVLSVRVGGYTMGSTSWQEADDRQYASFSFAVPVDRFEEAIQQARRLGKVTSENITSQDVTAQFVDVEARIQNLEATAERVRGFLAETQDLEYILEVNRELSRIEGDLESLKGQQNVLKQRTSFSRIYLDIVPPPVLPTTTEVLETAKVWSPVATFNEALAVLLDVLEAGADVAIWLVVIGLPVALIGWLIWTVLRRVLGGRVRPTVQRSSEAGA